LHRDENQGSGKDSRPTERPTPVAAASPQQSSALQVRTLQIS
jgi:hypothetical protein